jgi:pimeloyl-ACP methyl ester carboxylesterase
MSLSAAAAAAATTAAARRTPSIAVSRVARLAHLGHHHKLSLAAFARAAYSTSPQSIPFFPCVEAHATRESRLQSRAGAATPQSVSTDPCETGPEPPYARPNPHSYQKFTSTNPLPLVYYPNNPLWTYDIAYETWGTLNADKSNAILLHTGLSASSHAASTAANPSVGWWEKFIGPGKALDTNEFFVICTNVLGGCYGSTGPSSIDPDDPSKRPYGTKFPILSIFDMVRAQFMLLDHLGINNLYASVGSSMGGMQSLAAGWLHPERVGKIVSMSGSARSSPAAIAMRFAQRSGAYTSPFIAGTNICLQS